MILQFHSLSYTLRAGQWVMTILVGFLLKQPIYFPFLHQIKDSATFEKVCHICIITIVCYFVIHVLCPTNLRPVRLHQSSPSLCQRLRQWWRHPIKCGRLTRISITQHFFTYHSFYASRCVRRLYQPIPCFLSFFRNVVRQIYTQRSVVEELTLHLT